VIPLKRSDNRAHYTARSQNRGLRAQSLDLLQLVGDKDDGEPLFRQLTQRREKKLFLRLGDARSRLIQDNDSHAKG